MRRFTVCFLLLFLCLSSEALAGEGKCKAVQTKKTVDKENIVQIAAPSAQWVAKKTGVPASVTLSQFILESGWGQFDIGVNNYFGIKAQRVLANGQVNKWAKTKKGALKRTFNWGSVATGCVVVSTTEYVKVGSKTKAVKIWDAFRAYPSMKMSIMDHGQFFLVNPRYAKALKTKTANAFAKAIAKAGYATDPKYASMLIKLMKSQNLYQYDK